jgi:uncharacterized protein YkwD
MLAETNRMRALAGVQELTIDDRLQEDARKHAEWMASNRQMVHSKLTYARAENIASGYPNAFDVLQGWLKSPGHCENLLDKRFSKIGISTSKGNGKYPYYIQQFR